jgi:hypothetical protein
MPNTTNYGFDYESPSSLPGVTLTGGPTTSSPILAVQVDNALAALESTVTSQASDIATLEASDVTINTSLTNLTNWSRRGSTTIGFTALSSFTVVVSFGFTFPATPTVVTNIDSGAGPTARWESRAIGLSTTGFTMFVYASDSTTDTWVDIPVSYIALYRA